jgi:hypothetical protein
MSAHSVWLVEYGYVDRFPATWLTVTDDVPRSVGPVTDTPPAPPA